jgi:hypothetical protein
MPDQVYVLHIALHPEALSPLIWRRLEVDASVSLYRLHHFIQAAMGWHDAHLHSFHIAGKTYRLPDREMDSPDFPTFDPRKASLRKVCKPGDRFTYLYDFGDSWRHEITVEDGLNVDGLAEGDCDVLDGARACPPEDVGGVPGYLDFLREIGRKRLSQEGKRLLQWAGGSFDPELFDRRAANAAIKRILWNHWGLR